MDAQLRLLDRQECKMSLIPLKTNDVVTYQKRQYLIKSVQITSDGAIIEALPVSQDTVILHSDDVTLSDKDETNRRAKSLNIERGKNNAE